MGLQRWRVWTVWIVWIIVGVLAGGLGLQAQVIVPVTSPVAPVAPGAPPSASGVGEVLRLADELQRASEDVKRLQVRIPDWAGVSWYAEENAKLGAPEAGERRVVFLGDSITHNWGGAKYSDYFQKKHDGFTVANRGIGGQNVAQMVLRMKPDVIDLQPKVLVIFAGTNDLPTFKVPDLMRFIEDNFGSVLDLAQAHGMKVVVCSLLPVSDAYQNRTASRPPALILQLNAWLKETAQRRGMEYVDFYSALTDGHDRLKKDLTLDGLHPTAAGYVLMEPLVDAAILKSLARAR